MKTCTRLATLDAALRTASWPWPWGYLAARLGPFFSFDRETFGAPW